MGVDSFDIRNFVLCNKTMHFPEVLAYIINFVSMVTRWQCFHVVLILIVIMTVLICFLNLVQLLNM